MTNEQLLTIIISLGGLILTVALALAGLILVQARATRRDFSKKLSTIGSELRDVRSDLKSGLREAARERGELRDRLGRIEGYLDALRQFFVGNRREADRSQTELLSPSRESATSLFREKTRTHRQSNRGIM